jgi:hypothetical protein
MRKRATLIALILAGAIPVIFPASHAHAQLPAFPGADGAAAFVSGGRGGIVYHVTVLDRNFSHTNAGTLRYGLNNAHFPAGTRRTIVFDVGGTFWLGRYGAERGHYNGWDTQDRLDIPNNVTIAGQTAPGFVYIMGGVVKPGNTNIIIRNVTVAPGYGMRNFEKPDENPPELPVPGTFPDDNVYDAFDISGQNVMIDHCTTVYATDETISCNEFANNLTVQHCNISQGQNYPQDDAEGGSPNADFTGHALGSLLQAGSNFKISILGNLYAQQKGRLPRVGTESAKLTIPGIGAINDFRNNVFYNWLGTAGGGASGQPSTNNFINNFYLAGPGGDNPAGGSNSNIVNSAGGTGIFNGASTSATKAYVSGNIKDTVINGSPNDTSSADGNFSSIGVMPAAFNVNIGATLKATNAFRDVLRHVGSRWWERDYDFLAGNTNDITTIDERLVHETYTGTGKIIAWADDPFNTNSNEGVEWKTMLSYRADTNTFAAPYIRPAGWDTDQDGMPDYWEQEHGLNPSVTNNNADFDDDGYTDLEEYLNEIAAWPAPGNIIFNGNTNNRYALIHNWQVNGEPVNISGLGTVTTSSPWQPSKHDTAIISNSTVVGDSVGQHAGILRLAPDAANNATLNITNGWLKVADTLEIATAGTAAANLSGGRLYVSNLVIGAGSGLFNFTGGTLSADVVGFDLVNQGGAIAPGSSPGQTHVSGDLTLQAGSSLEFELGTQSDTIVVDGDLTLGGTLNITNLTGFGLGAYTLITYDGALSGSLTIGSKPAGYDCFVDTSTPGQVQLVVVTAPAFQSIQAVGDSVIMGGVGPTNISYRLIASTDSALALNLWTPIATNAFDTNGQFFITNLIDPNQLQTFYRLRVP